MYRFVSIFILFLSSVSASGEVYHVHGTRGHSHVLPSQGVAHNHNGREAASFVLGKRTIDYHFHGKRRHSHILPTDKRLNHVHGDGVIGTKVKSSPQLLMPSPPAAASIVNQVIQAEKRENLKTCITGKYPSLCKHHLLSASERQRVVQAEKRENLKTCITGKYPSLCKHHLLSASERQRVVQAEKRENLKTCITGKYPSLCKHHLLSASERQRVVQAEKKENTKVCLSGKYPSLCNKELLTKSTASTASTKYICSELTATSAMSLYLAGHTYLDRDSDGKPCEPSDYPIYTRPTYSNCHMVSGYYRKSGTYVRGHMRCR